MNVVFRSIGTQLKCHSSACELCCMATFPTGFENPGVAVCPAGGLRPPCVVVNH